MALFRKEPPDNPPPLLDLTREYAYGYDAGYRDGAEESFWFTLGCSVLGMGLGVLAYYVVLR